MHYTYSVLPHAGVSHLEYEGKLYELAKLTDFEKSFLYDKTTYIAREPVAEPVVTVDEVPVPAARTRKAKAR